MASSEPFPDVQDLSQLVCDDRLAFDCFNDDLVWILDKLVHRTGGIGGIISGHLTDAQRPTLLAVSSQSSGDAQLVYHLTLRAGGAPLPAHPAHDVPQMSHSLLNLRGPGGSKPRHYRILQLVFAPTRDVKIVATVAKESRLGFNFLDEAVARRLYPVLSRYVGLWWTHRAERRRAQTLSAVIDQSPLGVVLLNRDGRLLLANSHARKLLDAHDGLQHSDGLVTATGADNRQCFFDAIKLALGVNQDAQTANKPFPLLQMERPGGRRALMVTVSAVIQPAVDASDPAAIIYVLDPDQDVEKLLEPVCDVYKFTAAEARLVHHLVSGQRVIDAAQLMQIRPDTARAYLKQVFSKTRTHRQADLVRVMLTSAFPAHRHADNTV